MKKLFKEVIKSLSKNKLLMIGLSILIFLSSGVFTLVSNVRNAYTQQFQDYKNVSKLQDSTVDLNINALGRIEKEVYEDIYSNAPELNTYYLTDKNSETIQNLNIPLNKPYISLIELGINTSNSNNIYIKSQDLTNLFVQNESLSNSNKNIIFDLSKNIFTPKVNDGINLVIYEKNNDKFLPKKISKFVNQKIDITLDKKYKLQEIASISKTADNQDDYLTNLLNLYINLETKEATFDIVKSKVWANAGILYTYDKNKLANLLGFATKDDNENYYFYNKEIASKNANKIFFNLIDNNNSNSLVFLKTENYTSINKEATSINLKINNINLEQKINYKIFSTQNFANNKSYSLNPEWSEVNNKKVQYIRHAYRLSYLSEPQNWTGSYRSYIEDLKEKSPNEFEKLSNIHYWEKKIIYTDKNSVTKEFSSIINNDDIKEKINLINQNSTTIQNIEDISNSLDFLTLQNILVNLSDKEIKNKTYLKIREETANFSKKDLINHISQNKEVVDYGIRETLTVNDFNDKSSSSEVFHFINSGQNGQFFDGRAQGVGKLYNETFEKSENSDLFLVDDKSFLNKLEPSYTLPLVSLIFSGLLPDEKYLIPNIRFINFEKEFNFKIVVLKSLLTLKSNYAIGQNMDYTWSIFTKKENDSTDNSWKKISTFKSEYEVNKYINEKKLIIDAKLGETWLEKKDNVYTLPFWYVVPKKSIIKEVNDSNTLSTLNTLITDFLSNSQLAKDGYLEENDLKKLFNIARRALEKNEIQKIFLTGKLNNKVVPKMIVEIFDEANKVNGENFTEKLILKFLEKVKENVLYSTEKNIKNLRTIEEQKKYFNTEINKVWNFIETIIADETGKTIISLLQSISSSIEEPEILFNELEKIISALNINKILENLNKWYEEYFDKLDKNNNLLSLGAGDIIKIIFKTSDINQIILSLINIVDTMNFDQLFDNNNLYSINNLLKNMGINLDTLIKQINNSNNVKSYNNVKIGIKNLLLNIDFQYLLNNLDYVLEKRTSQIPNSNLNYVSNEINTSKMIALLVKSFSTLNSNQINLLKQYLIDTLNLSSASSVILGINAISSDPEKIDLQDFLDLLSKPDASSKKQDSQFSSPLQFRPNAFLDNDNKLIEKKIEGKEETFGDKLWQFYFQNIGRSNQIYLTLIKAFVKVQLGKIAPKDFDKQIAQIFSLFNKFAIENNNLTAQQKFDFLKSFINLSNHQNDLTLFLNDKELSTNLYNSDILVNATMEELKVTKGQVLVKETADTLWNYNTKNSNLNMTLKFWYDNLHPQIQSWFNINKYKATQFLGLIASGFKNENNFDKLSNSFVETFFNPNSKNILEDKDWEYLNTLATTEKKVAGILDGLGISSAIISTFLTVNYPELVIWSTASPNAEDGNLAFMVKERIFNLNNLTLDEIHSLLQFGFDEIKFNKSIETLNKNIQNSIVSSENNILSNDELNKLKETPVTIDMSWINWISGKKFENTNNSIFDINNKEFIIGFFEAIVDRSYNNNFFVMRDYRSYVAKINEGYASNNDKEIYTGNIPTNSIELDNLINQLDSKYILNVSGVKFIIVGFDNVVDYLYPIIDEENIQVDTHHQALVFVNDQGFKRIHNSFKSNAVKKYVLVQNKSEESAKQFVSDMNKYISLKYPSNTFTKAFLAREQDTVNPERNLRITIVENILDILYKFNLFVILILSFLATLSIVFATKRFVVSKSQTLGILKAQGYRNWEIASSMVIFAFFITTIGSTLGYLVGILLQNQLISLFSFYWTIPTSGSVFNFWELMATILGPFIILGTVVFITTLYVLRIKPTSLITGLFEINQSRIATFVSRPLKFAGIKTKFMGSLFINSIWKLIILFISTILTAFSLIFIFSSNGVFEKTINKTYEKRKYNYKINLNTPTKESGGYLTFDKKNLENLLYVVIGSQYEAEYNANNYFKPGWALINGPANSNINGNPQNQDPHILSKNSVSVKINKNGLNFSVWDLITNSLPETQKARILKKSNEFSKAIEKTQNIEINKKISYFKYLEQEEKFIYMFWNSDIDKYEEQMITTDQHREAFRHFLVESAKKVDVNDFYISFGGILFNSALNEKFSYGNFEWSINGKKENIIVNGYKNNSAYVDIEENGVSIFYKLNNSLEDPDIKPIIINHLVNKKYGISVGDILDLKLNNHVNRFYSRLINSKINENFKFKVVGINDTYVDNEFTTSQEVINSITGLNELPPNQRFNGILSKEAAPTQLTDNIGLFTYSNYWLANDVVDFTKTTSKENKEFFNEIFNNKTGVLNSVGLNDKQIKQFIGQEANQLDLSPEAINSDNYEIKHENIIKKALLSYQNIYGDSSYHPIVDDISSKDIEISFISNFSNILNKVTIYLIVLFSLISIIILIMLAKLIIQENEKNIAIFSILGYSNKEKIQIFFSIFIPTVIFSLVIAIPITLGFIVLLNNFLMHSSQIFIPLAIEWWHILFSFLTLGLTFVITLTSSYFTLNKIKAIHILKEK